MTTVRAQLNFLRMSPRKMRLVTESIKGLPVLEAVKRLSFGTKLARMPLLKLLNSALANAHHSYGVSPEHLRVHSVSVNQGSTLKRSTPKAFGRAAPIRRRSCHVALVLGVTEGIAVTKQVQTISTPVLATKHEQGTKVHGDEKEGKRATSPEKPTKGARKGFLRKMFQRKAA